MPTSPVIEGALQEEPVPPFVAEHGDRLIDGKILGLFVAAMAIADAVLGGLVVLGVSRTPLPLYVLTGG